MAENDEWDKRLSTATQKLYEAARLAIDFGDLRSDQIAAIDDAIAAVLDPKPVMELARASAGDEDPDGEAVASLPDGADLVYTIGLRGLTRTLENMPAEMLTRAYEAFLSHIPDEHRADARPLHRITKEILEALMDKFGGFASGFGDD